MDGPSPSAIASVRGAMRFNRVRSEIRGLLQILVAAALIVGIAAAAYGLASAAGVPPWAAALATLATALIALVLVGELAFRLVGVAFDRVQPLAPKRVLPDAIAFEAPSGARGPVLVVLAKADADPASGGHAFVLCRLRADDPGRAPARRVVHCGRGGDWAAWRGAMRLAEASFGPGRWRDASDAERRAATPSGCAPSA